MSFLTELFLAWRYFKPKRSAVSVITLLSVIGVALGVCVLIVVIAVMTGFTDHLKTKLLETGAHGQIQKGLTKTKEHPDGVTPFFIEDEAGALIANLKKKNGAVNAAAVLKSPVLLQVGQSCEPKVLLALVPPDDDRVKVLGDATKSFPLQAAADKAKEQLKKTAGIPRDPGKFSLKKNEVMISTTLAEEFNLKVGDKIVLHSQNRLMGLVKQDKNGNIVQNEEAEMYKPLDYKISGLYTFEKYDFDRNVIFMNLEEACELFALGDHSDENFDGPETGLCSTHIFLWVDDPFHMAQFNQSVRSDLISIYRNRILYFSWEDMNKQILGVLAVEKNMMFFLLIFIVLVAAFSITNTLITTVIQKTREIGLLKSMGVTSGAIMRIFVLQGAFVGILGSAFGVLLGWLVITYRMNILDVMRHVTGMEIFPKQLYLFNELPAHIVWSDVALIVVISILLCTCGALIPAFRAAKLDPARALRYE